MVRQARRRSARKSKWRLSVCRAAVSAARGADVRMEKARQKFALRDKVEMQPAANHLVAADHIVAMFGLGEATLETFGRVKQPIAIQITAQASARFAEPIPRP